MSLNEEEKKQSVFSLCLEALKRMNEEIVLTQDKTSVMIYKDPKVLLYARDKVNEVIDNDDKISIFLSKLLNSCFCPSISFFFL